jgi:hypothetical protein
MQFWLDVIARWEKRNHTTECIGLSATKDVQDAILQDPVRSRVVNVIDIRQWHYQKSGKLYAPGGGLNLAPRQLARLYRPRESSFSQVYRAVREYRERYPGKAVIYSAGNYTEFGWAVFMAGGSLANIPVIADPAFLADAIPMRPADLPGGPADQWMLADPGKGYIIYAEGHDPVRLDLQGVSGRFSVRRINPRNGSVAEKKERIRGGRMVSLSKDGDGAEVLWISRN